MPGIEVINLYRQFIILDQMDEPEPATVDVEPRIENPRLDFILQQWVECDDVLYVEWCGGGEQAGTFRPCLFVPKTDRTLFDSFHV